MTELEFVYLVRNELMSNMRAHSDITAKYNFIFYLCHMADNVVSNLDDNTPYEDFMEWIIEIGQQLLEENSDTCTEEFDAGNSWMVRIPNGTNRDQNEYRLRRLNEHIKELEEQDDKN